MGSGNGDQEDITEDGTWSCPMCGESGTCVTGDEGAALTAHVAFGCPAAQAD